MDQRTDEFAEEDIPRKKYSSPSKQSAKKLNNISDANPRFQQLIEDLNAFKSLKFILLVF